MIIAIHMTDVIRDLYIERIGGCDGELAPPRLSPASRGSARIGQFGSSDHPIRSIQTLDTLRNFRLATRHDVPALRVLHRETERPSKHPRSKPAGARLHADWLRGIGQNDGAPSKSRPTLSAGPWWGGALRARP